MSARELIVHRLGRRRRQGQPQRRVLRLGLVLLLLGRGLRRASRSATRSPRPRRRPRRRSARSRSPTAAASRPRGGDRRRARAGADRLAGHRAGASSSRTTWQVDLAGSRVRARRAAARTGVVGHVGDEVRLPARPASRSCPTAARALAGPLDSGWWLPTHRPGVLADGDVAVSESEEAMFLALLAWDPAPWTYWLTDGGAGTDGDPAQTPGPPVRPAAAAGARLPARQGRGPHRHRRGPVPARRPGHAAVPVALHGSRARARVRPGRVARASRRRWLVADTPGQVGPGPVRRRRVVARRGITRYGFTERTHRAARRCSRPRSLDAELRLIVCRDLRKRPDARADAAPARSSATTTRPDRPRHGQLDRRREDRSPPRR